MTTRDISSGTTVDTGCPKQPWVMMMFSDDEAIDRESVPPGLRFHLSRCPACSALADRLTAVTKSLDNLSEDLPAGNLMDEALGRVRGLLEEGPVLTGRVEIPDEPVVLAQPRGRSWVRLPWIIGSAMAACLLVAFTAVWMFSGPAERGLQLDLITGESWYDLNDELNQYYWQDPAVKFSLEGPLIPIDVNTTNGLAERVEERPLIYFLGSPAPLGEVEQSGNASPSNAIQRSLDKPQHAVSTKDAAKDR